MHFIWWADSSAITQLTQVYMQKYDTTSDNFWMGTIESSCVFAYSLCRVISEVSESFVTDSNCNYLYDG